ncbi:DUF4136 domain-containing protein [Lysobacter sp. S4-A87]|uniref:DUF4136 domain-containing protein n=1 Tax=Lysobacter sp. S4-A87 TaxID=2925843 RepID=UPI001F53430C|nr:DUF4136 domain-containing protein [Lysobacter sp. S4-A87]UNK48717.1 DUF4136 domain-containing protein [Lysobacter sp. S4-A87]
MSKSATSLPGARYAWVAMPPQLAAEFDTRVQDPKLRQRMEASLDKALQAKGYRRTEDIRQADIAVAYRVGVRDTEETTVRDTGLASANEAGVQCKAGGCSQIVTKGANGVPAVKLDTKDIVEGGLLVEVLQPDDIRVLWRALYRGSVQAKHRGPVNLDDVAAKTLAELPGASKRTP